MKKIDALFNEYGESHQNSTNKAIHWICVPAIFFSIVGLIASIPSGPVQAIFGEGNPYANWATIVLILVIAYYIPLSISLTIGMTLFGLACIVLIQLIARTGLPVWLVSIIIFVVAWIGQFY